MVSIPLGKTDWKRRTADEPDILLENRIFESNPTNLIEQTALLSRPGLRRYLEVGEGPIRGMYSQPGSFSDGLFVVSGDELYLVGSDDTVTLLGAGIYNDGGSSVSMAATSNIGATPEFLWLADGRSLWVFTENAQALSTLTGSGTVNNGDKIHIDATYYQFTTGSVDAGSPAGTLANPWLVAKGVTTAEALDNLAAAINDDGDEGVQYSVALTAHPGVTAPSNSTTTLTIRARAFGVLGNGIVTVVDTGANLSFTGATMAGGGGLLLYEVPVPDDVGIISVGYIAGYIICVVVQGEGMNGRFYWVEPGETDIDPLNFATAERSPDPAYSVRVIGDQFWLFGANSTEVWYPTGDINAPFRRVQGQLFDRGVWDGTDAQIKGQVILVDNDGSVYLVAGGNPQKISDNSIEERIRKAMAAQKLGGL